MIRREIRSIAAFISVVFAMAIAQGDRPALAQEPKSANDTAATVRSLIAPWMENSGAPGVIVVVRQDGRTHLFPFGLADQAKRVPVTAESVFELASVTKVFTTTSLAMEVEAGRMKLTDSVARYAPFLDQHGGDIKQVTLLQLATHTSSLPRVPGVQRPDGQWNRHLLMEWFAQWRARQPPGSRYLYSNVAMGLLGYAIENREEKPLLELWREQFLRPLGMQHTFFAIPQNAEHLVVQGYGAKGQPVEHSPQGGWPAGGRLRSSGARHGEFLTANLGEREDLPRITQAMRLAQQPRFKVSEQLTLGLAWQRVKVNDELVIDKNGGLAARRPTSACCRIGRSGSS